MSEFATPVPLSGDRVALEPLTHDHAEGLRAVVAEDDLHRTWYTRIPAPDAVDAEIDRRLGLQQRGSMAPWAVRRLDTGAVCGATTYMNVRPADRKLEIGSTFLAPSAQRTGVNAETKLLLLTRAFEDLDCIAVEFRTHWHNHQSRTAIARLGAKQDGVLRNDQVLPDGSLRDTVVFSITAAEWPAVRAGLHHRLSR
ncbi:GNAT family N-acetyltransferase [Kineococcus rhizosphaerae]|uniref:RimJ/RimL family protein N-acetyltransferase n=1 Tax=Kineococcus rhizosphaerae TaxID=559628 RepID=A0A2T0R2W6_9ACTN|nr:GNAT family protein [Kineococcus rhizosphaerae]PRY14134.1 RimJ/RimL family protein N-acetyltransferase [Kineococcus rhizosphaerae]